MNDEFLVTAGSGENKDPQGISEQIGISYTFPEPDKKHLPNLYITDNNIMKLSLEEFIIKAGGCEIKVIADPTIPPNEVRWLNPDGTFITFHLNQPKKD